MLVIKGSAHETGLVLSSFIQWSRSGLTTHPNGAFANTLQFPLFTVNG